MIRHLFSLKNCLILLCVLLSGGGLLHMAQRVQDSEDRIAKLERALNEEREAVRVLKAEWAYLNRPDRLEELAEEVFELEGPAPVYQGSKEEGAKP